MKKRNHMRMGAVLLCMLLLLCMIPAASTAANYAPCSHHTEHDGDCGGADDKCAYICEECVAEVQALVDKLPSMKDISADNSAAVGAQLAAIDTAKLGLSDAALDKVDFQKYEDAIFVLTAPPGWCGLAIEKTYFAVDSGVKTPTPEFAFLDEDNKPALLCDMYGTSAASVEVEPDSGYRYIYLPEGTYTVSEEVEGDWLLSMSVNGEKDDDLTFTCEAGSGVILLAFQNAIDITVSYTYSDGEISNPDGIETVEAAVKAVKEKMEEDESISEANISIKNSASVSLPEEEVVVLPKATTLMITTGAKLTIEDGSSLTISDGASVVIEENASLDIPHDYYFWRDVDGKRIDKDGAQATTISGPTTLSGVMTLSKGIDIDKDGGVLTLDEDTFDYNGEECKPTVTVTYEKTSLTIDTDYEVTYGNNINATTSESQATVTVTGTGNYKGTLTATFTIEPIQLRVADVKIKDKMYDGGVTAEFENYGSLKDFIANDDVTLDTSNVKAEFKDSTVGENKEVTLSGYALKGTDAANYTLPSTWTSSASIISTDSHVHQEKKAATCTESALCGTCGEYYGDALGHQWSKWTKHSGTKHIRTCRRNDCGHAELELHSPDLICGPKAASCTDCGASGASDHNFDLNKWQADSAKHWRECTECGERKDEAAHDYNDNVGSDAPQTCPTCKYGGHITRVSHIGFKDEDIPSTLKSVYKTVNEIRNAMTSKLAAVSPDTEDSLLYDAILEYSVDGGVNWYKASENYFPDDGKLPVKMEVPEGTDIDKHNYTVLHMFSSNAFGKTAGDIETPDVLEEKGEDGKQYISFYITGLSPIMVAWEEAPDADVAADGNDADVTADGNDADVNIVNNDKPAGTAEGDADADADAAGNGVGTGDDSAKMIGLLLLLQALCIAAVYVLINKKHIHR